MNSFLLISPDQGSGFKPILSGKVSGNLGDRTGWHDFKYRAMMQRYPESPSLGELFVSTYRHIPSKMISMMGDTLLGCRPGKSGNSIFGLK